LIPATTELNGKIRTLLVPGNDAAIRIHPAYSRAAAFVVTAWSRIILRASLKAAAEARAVPVGFVARGDADLNGSEHTAVVPDISAAKGIVGTDGIATCCVIAEGRRVGPQAVSGARAFIDPGTQPIRSFDT
jgi:hypothetical protein